MKKFSPFMSKTHTYGQIATAIAMAMMLGVPAVICTVYDIWPEFSAVMGAVAPMLAVFIPTCISELLSFTPITGSSGYIGSIMGNVSNIKFPCAMNAMERTNSASSTEQGETVAMAAMCVSGIVTTIIVVIGLILLVPLQPILTTPTVSTATKYIMPALFGSMATGFFMGKRAGNYVIEGKMKLCGVVLIIALVLFLVFPALLRQTGFVMLGLIPVAILVARIFYKKGIVKVNEVK